MEHKSVIEVSLTSSDAGNGISRDLANAALPISVLARDSQLPWKFVPVAPPYRSARAFNVLLTAMPQEKATALTIDLNQSLSLRIAAPTVDSLKETVEKLCSRSRFPPPGLEASQVSGPKPDP